MGERSFLTVFAVSDGTGQTAADAARAAMSQFPQRCRMRTCPSIRSAAAAIRVAEDAQRAGGLVVFTLVNEEVERVLRTACEARQIPHFDLLGPLIGKFAQALHAEPHHKVGLLHGINDDYFRRIDAVEFAVRHDDGANLGTLYQADLVLTGVSRTSKTPLSMYLAQRGYKTGNVPIIRGMEAPAQLLEINPRKVFALMVEAERLVEIRRARARALGGTPFADYANPELVEAELREAKTLYRGQGWRTVDISARAVEENASRVIELFEAGAESAT